MSSSQRGFTPDTRDIRFVLEQQLRIGELSRLERYRDFDADTVSMLVEHAIAFTTEVVAPTMVPSDREGCRVVDGRVVMPDCLHAAYRQAYDLGWASLALDPGCGGQGAPLTVELAFKENLIAGNLPLAGLLAMTASVVGLIDAFGSEQLKRRVLPKLVSGRFAGTGCLSEPHAGSDVGASSTRAEPVGDGRYRIRGTKCWISGGDQDLSENIIHTVLARVEGAPSGTRGLSLFAVPAFRVGDDGSVGAPNDVTLVSIEQKMGLRGSPTCVLSFGEEGQCYGELLDEEQAGIALMFQAMNESRMLVGAIGLGGASAAYQHALAYAKDRRQGAHISRAREADAPRVAIIEHPDVCLNLAHMKVRVEAIRALLYATNELRDRALALEDPTERRQAADLVEILTPMCKAWSTEVGVDVIRTAIQVLGGVGYTKDFPLEQYYRDFRVATIFEGTTGIQALDLVGRKLTTRDGALFALLVGGFERLAAEAGQHPQVGGAVRRWAASCQRLRKAVAEHRTTLAERGVEQAFLYATPLMMFCSAVTAGYYYLQQGVVAAERLRGLGAAGDEAEARFCRDKILAVHFYVDAVLPTFEAGCVPMERRNYDALELMAQRGTAAQGGRP